jgi:hypothetical protein
MKAHGIALGNDVFITCQPQRGGITALIPINPTRIFRHIRPRVSLKIHGTHSETIVCRFNCRRDERLPVFCAEDKMNEN